MTDTTAATSSAIPKPASAREKIARLRADFVSQLPGRAALARQLGKQLIAAPDARDTAVELHRLFHSMKGTGRSFGFRELGGAAAQGEDLLASLLDPGSDAAPDDWPKVLNTCLELIDTLVGVACAPTAHAAEDMPTVRLPAAPTAEENTRGGRLVYLCDDDPLTLEQMTCQLACFGYETLGFADPQTLHEAVCERTPSAIVMDINFPEPYCSGTAALARLQQETGKAVPAIFLSAHNDFDARLAAVQSGGEAYFHKPVRAIEIIAALDEITRQQEVEPYRVLILDDEPEIAGYHAVILQEAGMVTQQLNDPRRILDVLAEFRPDMVLIDMYMPACSGRDVAKVIRQVPDHLGLPIVYLSSETDRQKQFSAMRVGAEGFMTKPVFPEDLVAAVAIRAERMRALRSLMARDSLTGLFNHTTTTQFLENAVSAARRDASQFCFVMIDIDKFKSINDNYGHPVGDQVILALSRVLQQRLRNSDIVGRYGGEEFAVILQDVTREQSLRLIDGLREDFAKIAFRAGAQDFHCTFSAGIASYPAYKRLETLREAADRALYLAKNGGRNKVVVSDAPGETS